MKLKSIFILAIFVLILVFLSSCDSFGNNTTTTFTVTTSASTNSEITSESSVITTEKFLVNFETNGGNEIDSIFVEKGSTLDLPIPDKEGFTFIGWYTGEGVNDTQFTVLSVVNSDFTLYANWQINQYTLTFISNGGNDITSITQDYASIVTEPIEPTKEGYTFEGWFIDSDLETAYAFNTMPAENITLYACWTINQYTITFNSNEGSSVTDITQNYASTVTAPAEPIKEGYIFRGWYSDSDLTTAYVFYKMPSSNITLYAKWHIITYDITYNLDSGTNGSNPSTYTVETTTIILDSPTKEGYTFNGWYDNTAYSGEPVTQIVLGTTGDIILYAKWSVNQYTITFDSNEGSAVTEITQDYATIVTAPAEPTRDGYTFDGWYKDSALTDQYIFSTMPAEDITLYCKWNVVKYNITYELDGGTIESNIYYYYINSSIKLKNPTKEGYTFNGWFDNQEHTGDAITMIPYGTTGDIIFYAKWTINQYTITYSIVEVSPNAFIVLNQGETIKQISLGSNNSAALTSSGRVFTWGNNSYGKLGDGSSYEALSPREITSRFSLEEGDKIIQISLSDYHSAALTSSGRLFTWGYNASGQLGNGTKIDSLVPIEITNQFSIEEGDKIIQISLGSFHSAALTSLGRLFTWGSNRVTPTEITSQFSLGTGDKIVQVSLGDHYSAILTFTGRVFTWGINTYGQLGDGSTTDTTIPIEITSQFSLEVGDQLIQISLGRYHSAALSSSGRLFTWGRNSYGQLGNGTTLDSLVPIEISNILLDVTDRIVGVSLGDYHSAALSSSGRLFTWGRNSYGQLGNDSTTDEFFPVEITNHFTLYSDESIGHISLGGFHSSALTSSGRFFIWGYNYYGQLGDNSRTYRYIPTESKFYSPRFFSTVYYYYNIEISEFVPTMDGYEFDGWYIDTKMTIPSTFNKMPAKDIILYGRWIPN